MLSDLCFSLKVLAFSLNPFCFDFVIRARTETRSSISDENLQCSQGKCETVSIPYPFDDDLHKGIIKEAYGAPSLLHLHTLSSFKYALPESHFLKVHFIAVTLSLSLSLAPSPTFLVRLSVMLVFWY